MSSVVSVSVRTCVNEPGKECVLFGGQVNEGCVDGQHGTKTHHSQC